MFSLIELAAKYLGKQAKIQLEDPEGLGLKKVVLKIDSSKAEIIDVFNDMSLQSASHLHEGNKLGFMIVVIGLHLSS